jgi:hypothetical protein
MNAYEFAKQLAQLSLQGEKTVTPELIREKASTVISTLPQLGYSDPVDKSALVKELESLYTVWIGKGAILDDEQDHIPWLPAKRADIDWDFWYRYRQYLELNKGWSPQVVDRLEQLTDSILERIENPERPGMWDRRGMVVGQVQSGKTSNYTGLICKAVDAGYKLVIVLAGLHNNLRSQTQLRLDEGFLGFNSQLHKAAEAGNALLGAGKIPIGKRLIANSGTNSDENGDFSTKIAKQYGVQLGGDPVLMVVKKNKTVLKNLVNWAITIAGMIDPETGRKVVRDIPLLVIDDEADNASVNTKEVAKDENGRPLDEQDCTAINALIRELLYNFEKSTYVGYTATPFANIFIHADVDTKRHGADLFPKHFIINLPAPNNYVGPVQVFGLETDSVADLDASDGLNIIRKVEDQEDWMPLKHKKSHEPPFLPPSLREAIHAFVLTCAVRIYRGQERAHNSMLIHVTRYTDVQARVTQLVKDYLTTVQRRLRYGEGNTPSPLIEQLRSLWEEDYYPTSQSISGTDLQPDVPVPAWSEIKPLLDRAAARLQVKEINGAAKDILDYWENPDGLNIIAIGGDKLSRGLTLEGLSVSYYLRASKMYDTLMQMGRWFGYRPGYLDLCRLYTTDELIEWYQHITVASEELRKEFDYMVAAGGTPSDFGLKVRTHPSGLLITGATKMRHGMKMQLSFAGSLSETYLFYKDAAINSQNLQATESLLSTLGTPCLNKETKGNFLWKEVEGKKIIEFLQEYRSHPDARLANTRSLVDYIRAQLQQGELESWTIALISSSKPKNSHLITGFKVGLTQRNNADKTGALPEYRLVKSRLLSPVDEMLDFTEEERQEIIEMTAQRREKAGKPESKSKTPDGKVIREQRDSKNGLLLIYPLDPEIINSQIPVIGFAISFPGSNKAKSVEYKVNNIYWEQEIQESHEG